ncbi:tyrosine-protein phosphatase non-receptor type 23 [Tribolium castaneum]|uniref:Tyrosine-protein phosphatase non-receptor type 23-like Protein n=1 Tax=Tribolium castaneum TaxID=7070 RepID=D6WNP5_TRICA|nr:PREDICTED: tyrosine-protein phosphatase non-receptor type 23 [Tribolium castaneum]XP_970590.1 PREDICTED: tyrosine-protein phosphatase non-receptor type 23 [Tribolium castaneum]EFA03751.2 Tyrosine-protein phosphatase non-receptor type 23-like Protein [Tribolium castaneum]|eukprot:XP_008192966.1 PREDICTED: tyrosine-protein phosphatase non-receptor type 23 [Tribolium castaneum]
MEAVPRLPMISFELKTSPENAQFGPQLKQYIATFYNEDPESYSSEISNLESLRAAAIRPTIDVAGCQLLKKYYCQLHFLKSRFPMSEGQAAAVYFTWKDNYTGMLCNIPDIRFELMCILYNIGALHTQLGALDCRSSADGLKMACTHFQCAAWAFQTVKETYHQMVPYMSSVEAVHFMQQVCFAQAQECILEKSMMDNRKATITAKVAVQVVDHYKRALSLLSFGEDSFSNIVGTKTTKEWNKYLSFKISYHKCIALLFQGQQAEEQQKMGERVAFYQAACEQLEEARKLSTGLKQQKDLNEAIAFTSDVVEGKRKAAKNENEFIYHEEVPDKHALQEVKGASLVKGIAFNVNDVEVSGPDIFARLVPMEAHEASSLYSEKKAQKLRQLGELVESKDQALAEFMSSLQLDVFTQMRQATGLCQDLVDRAAALSAKPSATQDLVAAMGRLSNSYHEVESMLNEIQDLLKEEEQSEKEYQELMGKRPPSIIATDLAREAAKYREAHNKANDSNQNLHKAMMTHVANLKILAQPLGDLQKQIPSVELPNPNIDENCVREIESLISKVEEMRNQRAMLWSQFREAVHKDDITSVLVTRKDQPLDQVFQQELEKHHELTNLIEQNVAAQENILKAFVDAYARSMSTRRYLQDVINKRTSTVSALITSYDTYEDLVAKANKGIDFYNKLETNVSKLLQRIKSACKVQQEEREQMLLKNSVPVPATKEEPVINSAPKLKDFIDTRKKTRGFNDVSPQYYPQGVPDAQTWPPAVRPAPLGSEINEPVVTKPQEQVYAGLDQNLADRMASLRMGYYGQNTQVNKQAYTTTTDTYQPISSSTQNNQVTADNIGGQYQGYQMSYSTPSTTSLGNYGQVGQPGESYPQVSQPYQNYAQPDSYSSYNQASQLYNQTPSLPNQAGQLYNQTPSLPNQASQLYNQPTTSQHDAYTTYSQTGQPYGQMSVAQVSQPYNQTSQVVQPDVYTNQYNQVSQPNVYYPAGYGPAQVQPTEQTYSYPNTFGSNEYATSVHPNISNVSYNSTYSSPGVDLKSSDSNSKNYVISNGQGYTSYDQYQYYYNYGQNQTYPTYGSGYNYATPSPQTSDTSITATTKESNIDLLTGLDFTVNQAPLIPQQKPSDPEIKPPQKTETPVKQPTKVVKNEEEPPKIERVVNRKPLNNSEVKKLFGSEIDKFEKFVDVLTNKTLSGPTNLDLKWKEIQDKQDVEKKAISVARCYPMKNRFPDILPYDYSRVELKAAKDDYINASYVKDVSYYSAPFIVTQAPLAATASDFWTMIKEQNVELIVCLLNDAEIGADIYWPLEKGRDLSLPGMSISLISATPKPHWTERLIAINVPEKRDSRVLMHLQFTSWPGSLFPTNPDHFVAFVTEVINLFMQQRNTNHPVVVHCLSGIGRSGLVCLLVTAILEVTSNPTAVPDLVSLAVKLGAWRRNILRDREHLKFAFEAFLSYMKQVVAQGKILNDVGSKKKEEIVSEIKQEDDPLSSLDPFWANKKKE